MLFLASRIENPEMLVWAVVLRRVEVLNPVVSMFSGGQWHCDPLDLDRKRCIDMIGTLPV